MGFTYTVASRWRNFGKGVVDFEDLLQDCNLTLVKASRSYDPDKGIFSNYAYLYMMGKMEHTLKTKKVEKIYRNTSSLDYDLSPDSDGSLLMSDVLGYEEKYFNFEYMDLVEAIDKLDREEKEIITALYFDGLKQKDIAKMKGYSQPFVSRIHSSAKENIKFLLTNRGYDG